MIRFGIIRFGSVNDTEASVFGYSVFTRFVRPLMPAHLDTKLYMVHASLFQDQQKFREFFNPITFIVKSGREGNHGSHRVILMG